MRLGVGGFQRPSLGVGVSRFRSSSTASAPPAGFSPETTFTSGDLGWVYDFDDMDTLWADTAATIPAVMNGRVARVDDKSLAGLNRTQSTEANRPFLRGTPTGANTFSNFSSPGTGWVNNGNGTATATTSSAGITASGAATAGRVYRVIYTITRTAGSVTPSMGGVSGTARSAAGTYIEYFDASNTNALVFTGSGYSGVVSAIDIRDASADSVTTPNFLHYNGTSSSMQSASTNFTSKTFFTVVAGFRAFGTSTGNVVEMSTNASTQNGAFGISTTGSASTAIVRGNTGSPALLSVTGASQTAGAARVQTGLFNTAGTSMEQNLKLRTNGVADSTTYGTTVTVQSGTFGTHVVYFGSRSGTSQRLYGLEGSSAAISKSLSSAVLTQYEQWAADKCGLSALGSDTEKDGVAPSTYSGITFWYDAAASTNYEYVSPDATTGQDTYPTTTSGDVVMRGDSLSSIARVWYGAQESSLQTSGVPRIEISPTDPSSSPYGIYVKPASGASVDTAVTTASLVSASTAVVIVAARIDDAGTAGVAYTSTPIFQDDLGYIGLYANKSGGNIKCWAYNFDSASADAVDPGTFTPGSWVVATLVHRSGRLMLRINGSIVANVASGNTGNTTGACSFFRDAISDTPEIDGAFNTLLTYNSALTDQRISNVEKALCQTVGATFRG